MFRLKYFWRHQYSNMSMGKFIVLEGLDRTGKSSMVSMLQQKLEEEKRKVVGMGFPNRKSPTGMMINDFLTNKAEINDETIHLLFSANRWEAIKEIQELLKAGNHIICDRYWYSGVAYSYAKGLDLEWCMAPDEGLIEPDLVIYLNGDPQKLAKRKDYGNERFQKIEFQTKVSDGFSKLINKLNSEKIKVVNVDDKELQEVKNEVFALVNQSFKIDL